MNEKLDLKLTMEYLMSITSLMDKIKKQLSNHEFDQIKKSLDEMNSELYKIATILSSNTELANKADLWNIHSALVKYEPFLYYIDGYFIGFLDKNIKNKEEFKSKFLAAEEFHKEYIKTIYPDCKERIQSALKIYQEYLDKYKIDTFKLDSERDRIISLHS